MPRTLWRRRLTYAAMSALVAWHTFSIAIATASPDSPLVSALRSPVAPYLSLLDLTNRWQFFAPNINRGTQLRYVVKDRAGRLHTFMPREELSWLSPTFIWFNAWYQEIIDEPVRYGGVVAAILCEKHAALQPVARSRCRRSTRRTSFRRTGWRASIRSIPRSSTSPI